MSWEVVYCPTEKGGLKNNANFFWYNTKTKKTADYKGKRSKPKD